MNCTRARTHRSVRGKNARQITQRLPTRLSIERIVSKKVVGKKRDTLVSEEDVTIEEINGFSQIKRLCWGDQHEL